MGAISFWHCAILIMLVALMFGKNKISSFMSDLGKGIKSFRSELSGDISRNDSS